MPSKNYFHKILQRALEEQILPMLAETPDMPHIYAGPPFRYDEVKHWIIQKELLPSKNNPPQQIINHWKEYRVKCSHFQRILLVYEGTADIRIGLNAGIAQTLNKSDHDNAAGLVALRLPAPSVIYFPPGYAFSDGRWPFQETNICPGVTSRALFIEIFDVVLLGLMFSNPSGIYTTHALEAKNDKLKQALKLYLREYEKESFTDDKGTKAYLQKMFWEIMQHLSKHLQNTSSFPRNTSWPPFEYDDVNTLSGLSNKNKALWEQISLYIDSHLDYDLNWEILSKELGNSAVHLNRIFRQATGTTMMRYVTKRRLDAAKLILIEGTLPIKQIATYVGFPILRNFSYSFKRYTGHSPRQYRKLYGNPVGRKRWSYDE